MLNSTTEIELTLVPMESVDPEGSHKGNFVGCAVTCTKTGVVLLTAIPTLFIQNPPPQQPLKPTPVVATCSSWTHTELPFTKINLLFEGKVEPLVG
jgi:hypothetical protein